jgi:ATP-dependent DNA helicase MPH1
MPATDDEDYGDIADEDFIEAFSQASQSLPPLHDDSDAQRRRRTKSRTGSGASEEDEDANKTTKKRKYRIHTSVREVPPAQIIGATQAECLPDSSPYRIRGPIYKKPRPEPPEPQAVSKSGPLSAPRRLPTPEVPTEPNTPERLVRDIQRDEDFARELQGLPSDAFSSPEDRTTSREAIPIGSSPPRPQPASLGSSFLQRQAAASQSFRQTTLFGGRAPENASASQAKKTHNFIVDKTPEAPTHHVLDQEALKTWVYPMNRGPIRDYQYTIVRNALFNNLLVALPTGLGKTFIAATVMLNYFRWTKDAQIVFVAPTKPLVAQQVDACFTIVGLSRSATTMLTGDQAPALRAEEWETKRVFFMTPQTLVNDLSSGIADPKKIVLLVVDEAHRATGEYAYVKVVQFIRRFSKSFRVLALTATPGSTVESVQEVIDGLEIAKVEIRTEDSIDIQQFVHQRSIDQVLLDPSDEIIMVKELFAKALQPLVNLLCSQNAYYNKDPMSLTAYGLIKARKAWFMSNAGRTASAGVKGMMNGLFAVLAGLAHAIKLLNFHGIGPFYASVHDFRQGADGNKGSKYKNQIVQSPDFNKMMDRLQLWLSKPDFVGHPKITYLCDTILNHFLDAGDGRQRDGAENSETRVIVFSEYRESAEDIARVLNRHRPLIRASVFVGQADSKRSEGMNQAKQLDTIQKFKSGEFNVIVATSIGEEGLDIGQVDLIVCYDASGSPIRMLQRMGRTGRKRAGNIVLLLMRGKEEENFAKAKDSYEQMQKMIANGDRFNFRHDLSARIIPRDVTPVVDRRIVDIPTENTQDPSLPEPKRRQTRKLKKKPPKKFHMPDGVETGFLEASNLAGDGSMSDFGISVKPKKIRETDLEPIPSLESVLLSPADAAELERRFQNVAGSDFQEVEMPNMTSQTVSQRSLLPTGNVPHGQYTRKCVRLFQLLANAQVVEERYLRPYGEVEPAGITWSIPPLPEYVSDTDDVSSRAKEHAAPKHNRPRKRVLPSSRSAGDIERTATKGTGHQKLRQRAISISAEEDGSDYGGIAEHWGPAESEGEGDDITDNEERSHEDSDLGSLKDFLATSSSPIHKRKIPSTESSSPPSSSSHQLDGRSQFTATQDTNDDMPDIAELIDRTKSRNSRGQRVDSDSGHVAVTAGRREKRRRIIEDDSDE